MTCSKCGSHSFWWDAEDGWACSACRKPYGSPWPPPGPEAELARIEIKRFTWADRRRAVELSHRIGAAAAAQEFGVAESTIYDWRSELRKGE